MALRAVIIDSDAESRAAIARMLQNRAAVVGNFPTVTEAMGTLTAARPEILVLEIPDGGAVVSQLARRLPDTAIVATGAALSADLVLKIIRAGAFEFVHRPVTEPDLAAVVDKLARFRTNGLSREPGRVTAVFSPKGGLGVTTIAVNVAVCLAKRRGRVLLVELDSRQSDVGSFLDLKARYSVLDVFESLGRMDESLLDGLLTRHESGLFVLPSPSTPERLRISGEEATLALELLGASFEHIVLDLRHDVDPATAAALEAAHTILYLTGPNVAALRAAGAGLSAFRHLGISTQKVQVVLMRDGTGEDISARHVPEAVGLPVSWRIPNDYRAVAASIDQGRPLVTASPKSKAAGALRELAEALVTESGARSAQRDKSTSPLLRMAWPVRRVMGA